MCRQSAIAILEEAAHAKPQSRANDMQTQPAIAVMLGSCWLKSEHLPGGPERCDGSCDASDAGGGASSGIWPAPLSFT